MAASRNSHLWPSAATGRQTGRSVCGFRNNIKKDPNHWLVRTEAARLAVAKGDYEGATKEMKLAVAAAPDPAKSTLDGLLKRVEAKQDINE